MLRSTQAHVRFSNPATYRILILGTISQELWEHFKGDLENVIANEEGQPVSTLKFFVCDQIELSGIIDTLIRRHHVLLSVELDNRIEETQPL